MPAAAANLPDGRVMTWAAARKTTFTDGGGRTATSIFDPVHMTATDRFVANTNHDMFCPGTAQLADGRIMVTGGSNAGATSFYDPADNSWSTGPRMQVPRGYHSMTPLSNGDVFTLGGSWSGGLGGKIGEIWSPGRGWRRLSGIPTDSFETADPGGIFRSDNHMWLFEARNGRVFHAGPSRAMHWINTNGNGSFQRAGRRGDDRDAMNGNAVMYDIGRILTLGGSTSYSRRDPASNRSYTIDIRDGNNANVRRSGNMRFPRTYVNSVVLPSGEVVAVGGLSNSRIFTDDGAVLNAEIWNPRNGQWRALARMNEARAYHSIGLLLKDGRVMVGGGGLCDCRVNHLSVEVLTPPYLLNRDGSRATRPRFLRRINARASLGSRLTVKMNTNTNHDFALVRTGVVTHSTNNDQRRIPLNVVNRDRDEFTLQVPSNGSIVQPGEYFLFALNKRGVPSVAENIRITSGPEMAFRDSRGRFLRPEGGFVRARNNEIRAAEVFTLDKENDAGRIAIKTNEGNFLRSNADGNLTVAGAFRSGFTNFLLVNRSRTLTALQGFHRNFIVTARSGFARIDQARANVPEANFRAIDLTNRNVPRNVTLTDSEGRFIAIDSAGNLTSASREVAIRRDHFTLIPINTNRFALQSSSGLYVGTNSNGRLRAVNTVMGPNEQFLLRRNNDGTFAIRAVSNRRFVSVRPDRSVRANSSQLRSRERLRITFD